MKHKYNTVFFLSLLFLSGCLTPQGIISNREMEPSLQYQGYSIKRPIDQRWYLDTGEQNYTHAIFRMDGSDTHSIFTVINASSIAGQPQSIDEFEEDIRSIKTSSSGRGLLLDYTSSQSIRQGQWCINYSVKSLDTHPANSGSPLIMTSKGFVVLHPNWTNIVIDGYVSQRGKENELSSQIDSSGKSILNSVTLESSPGQAIN